MTELHSEFNPCCCISVRAGTTLISLYDMRNNFKWLALLCYVWLLFRVMLEISFLIYLNALIGSGIPHFVRYGQELFLNFALQIYFIVVVSMFIRESRMEFNNMRAIKPINIVQGEHEEYLSTDRSNKFFNTATSFHFLTPHESGIDGKLDISTPTVTITHSPQKDVELNNEDSVGTFAPLKGEYKDQPRSSSDIIHQDASGIMLYSAVNDFQAIQDQSTVSLEELPSLVRAFNTKEQQDEYEKTIKTNVKSGKESF
ncbi:hypothetical protein Ocin01_14040, partial [Orchesella cincta]